MAEGSDSSSNASRGRSLLCGFSGKRRSTTKKESQPHTQKSPLPASPNSPQEQTPSSSTTPTSIGTDGTKTKSGKEKATTKQNRSGERTRSFFRIRKKQIDNSTAQSGVRDEQGSSANAALETSPTSSSLSKGKNALAEIKPNIVSERRAAFAKSEEQPGKPIPEQQSVKKADKNYQSVPPEQLPSSSSHLEPTDESGMKAEKKKQSKPSFFQQFKSKGTSQETVKNAPEISKGSDKHKANKKGRSGDNDAETAEANDRDSSSVVATSSSHPQKSQSESKAKTVEKDAKDPLQEKENKKARESMMKAIYKRVEKLTVPELPKSAIVKSSPAIHQGATSTTADSPSEEARVEIPNCDDDDVFFTTPKSNANQSSNPSATAVDLNAIEREPILPSAKKARPPRNEKTSGNPVKKLAERDDLVTSYVEKQPKPAENKSPGFAKEALAGLASTEDFSRVELRKSVHAPANRNQPFKDLMLLLVKGRKCCHARLVEPCARSINAGDSYVLKSPKGVYVWLGDSCNVHEKSKAPDVAQQIVAKRDLGCTTSAKPIIIGDETKHNSKLAEDFWSILGEKKVPKVQEKGPQEEDEIYEKSVYQTNVVYKVTGNHLEPLDEYCGRMLSYTMLNTHESAVLVFDFGGEMYVWSGKQSLPAERKYGMQLAEELWKKGYDYTSFTMNPLSPLCDKKKGGLPLKSNVRPPWALIGKFQQNTETILFKEKFSDWPNPSRMIKSSVASPQNVPFVELKPCDVGLMIESKREPVSIKCEELSIGRCLTWVKEADGFKKEYEIETEGIDVWQVAEFACNAVDEAYHGQFYDGDTYVVRWRFQVNGKGLGGKGPGRTRCIYFYWMGEGSSVTQKGACALMTVELDKEGGPQIRVDQNKEPPCFLALFKGRMIVHKGKKDDKSLSSCKSCRLYLVRNELPDEAYLMEIQVQLENLRSRSSFLLLNAESDRLTIWHGARSPEHTRQRDKELTVTLRKWLSLKFSCDWKMLEVEVNEGSESAEFWKAIGSSDRSQYDSLLKSSVSSNRSLHRAFLLSGVTLSFVASEIVNPSLNENLPCPFPLFQSDLYRRSQPALFLIDVGDLVYLWQGYWPLQSNSTENLRTGSAVSRFNEERRCAMETVLAYCKAVNSTKPPPAYIVYAGVEPITFTNLFPSWCTDEKARASSLQDGKKLGETKPVHEALANMQQRKQYTMAELTGDPLPDGVDRQKLESYLTDEEFKEVFKCDKDEFYLRPDWKQKEAKESFGLH